MVAVVAGGDRALALAGKALVGAGADAVVAALGAVVHRRHAALARVGLADIDRAGGVAGGIALHQRVRIEGALARLTGELAIAEVAVVLDQAVRVHHALALARSGQAGAAAAHVAQSARVAIVAEVLGVEVEAALGRVAAVGGAAVGVITIDLGAAHAGAARADLAVVADLLVRLHLQGADTRRWCAAVGLARAVTGGVADDTAAWLQAAFVVDAGGLVVAEVGVVGAVKVHLTFADVLSAAALAYPIAGHGSGAGVAVLAEEPGLDHVAAAQDRVAAVFGALVAVIAGGQPAADAQAGLAQTRSADLVVVAGAAVQLGHQLALAGVAGALELRADPATSRIALHRRAIGQTCALLAHQPTGAHIAVVIGGAVGVDLALTHVGAGAAARQATDVAHGAGVAVVAGQRRVGVGERRAAAGEWVTAVGGAEVVIVAGQLGATGADAAHLAILELGTEATVIAGDFAAVGGDLRFVAAQTGLGLADQGDAGGRVV